MQCEGMIQTKNTQKKIHGTCLRMDCNFLLSILQTASKTTIDGTYTLPPIIMEVEVENDPIVEETSLVGTHSPLP